MRINTTKANLAEGKVVFGAIISRHAPDLVELFGAIGYDFVMIDCEHGPMSLNEVEHMVRAAEVFGITPITRIPNLQLRRQALPDAADSHPGASGAEPAADLRRRPHAGDVPRRRAAWLPGAHIGAGGRRKVPGRAVCRHRRRVRRRACAAR